MTKFLNVYKSFNINEVMGSFLDSLFLEIKKKPFFDCEVQDIRIKTINYLRYSIILKLKVITSKGDRQIVAKITKNSDNKESNDSTIRKEWQALNDLNKEFGSQIKNVIKPLLYFEKDSLQAMITEEIIGETLHSLLTRRFAKIFLVNNSSFLKQHLYSCGKWLRKFQNITRKQFDKEVINVDIFNKVHKQLEECDEQNILNRRLMKELHDYVVAGENLFNKSSSWSLAGTHSDFIPVNIMVKKDDGAIVVLDFVAFKYSLPHRDVMSFLCSLDFLANKFLIKRRTIEKWKVYFLEGYGKLDKINNICQICSIRENLGYLMNLYYMPNKTHLQHIALSWNTKMIERFLWKIIKNEGGIYENQ